MKKGFTIVELSIVLVIIGLLVGGILVGQSLIDSAKISKEVRRLSQYSVAIIQFKQKFKQEAGDSAHFTPQGNDNRSTTDQIGVCPVLTSSEGLAVWAHLSQAQMLSETYIWDSAKVCAGDYSGVAPLAGDIDNIPFKSYFSFESFESGSYVNSPYQVSSSGPSYHRKFGAAYGPLMLMGLEVKIDDGIPSQMSSGSIAAETDDYFTTPNSAYPCTVEGVAQEIQESGEQFGYCSVHIYFSPVSTPELAIMPR